MNVGTWVVSGVLLILSALVAGAEATVVSLPFASLRALRDELGPKRGASIARYLNDPPLVLARLFSFRSAMVIIASGLSTRALCSVGAESWVFFVSIAGLVLVYGLVAELAMSVGRARARSLASIALRFSRPLEMLVSPLALPIVSIGRLVQRRLSRNEERVTPVSDREVEYMVEEAGHAGALDPRRTQLMHNVLELKDKTARDVMVPRIRMSAIELGAPIESLLKQLSEDAHSRMPVYRGQIDNVVGVLHVKDLFRTLYEQRLAGKEEPVTLESLLRKPAFFVAEGQNALAVLRDMQSRRMHMAVVVDEFGAVVGLVTLEDVLEQLVGDIQDEHDVDEAKIVRLGGGRFLVAAATSLTELRNELDVEFPEEDDYNSLGGFMAARAGRVPAVGQTIEWNGMKFTVREGDRRKVLKVEIERPAAAAESDAPGASSAGSA